MLASPKWAPASRKEAIRTHYCTPMDRPPYWRDIYRAEIGGQVYRIAFDIRPASLGGFDFCLFSAWVDDRVVGGCCGSLNFVPQLEAAALSRWLHRFLTPAHIAAGIVPNAAGYLMLGANREPPLDTLCEALGVLLIRE